MYHRNTVMSFLVFCFQDALCSCEHSSWLTFNGYCTSKNLQIKKRGETLVINFWSSSAVILVIKSCKIEKNWRFPNLKVMWRKWEWTVHKIVKWDSHILALWFQARRVLITQISLYEPVPVGENSQKKCLILYGRLA